MVSKTNEQALEEEAIECSLVSQGYQTGKPRDFNARYGLDTTRFWAFLKATQLDELEKLQKTGADWQQKVLDRFERLVKKNGLLHLLKKGLSVDNAHFTLLYPAPLASSSKKVKERFAANVFSCTRQVHYSLANPRQSMDMVLFINGLPFATLELKNLWTGQSARFHGQKQYREDRDNTQPLLQFGRCLVHMAVDTDEVFMTTKLAGKNTLFLPFNKGHDFGAGNPPNPKGHKTAYLWQEVFSRESIAAIIQHFVRLDGTKKDPLNKRTLFFPRYHQRDVVRKLVKHAAEHGVGETYLIQHSAGSGKSNSITWAAYQLIETYPANATVRGARSVDEPLFDSVIVVTDRRLLDKQLRDNIREFSEVQNIVAPAMTSKDLKTALEQGKKIIITTIQKFPFILDGISDLSDKRFAVIIDEAHSSQDGDIHGKMNQAMGKEEEVLDGQDKILQFIQERKIRGNASYFAFTATPKNATLEKFGEKQDDGKFRPFHLYSMKQAIEEGFILDVLANYTTYKSYYEIQKTIQDNPDFDTARAQKKLKAYVERHQRTIDQKAEIMLDHFIPHVVNSKKLKGQAKGMVITQNIETAIRYYQAINRELAKRNHPFKAVVAFSGSKTVDGIEYTEPTINGFPEGETKEHFDKDDYRLLIVANKYLTGFDQQKLTAMYVDRKLQGVLAVQALSRLNRASPKWGKKTEDLFVLDFFNSIDDIKSAFDPFYTSTTLSEATDVNVLNDLKELLTEAHVYVWQDVESFNELYWNDADAQQLSVIIDKIAQGFNTGLGLEDQEKVEFKVQAKQFVKIYAQMAAIMPFEMVEWEKLFWFLKFLIPKLIIKDREAEQIDELLNAVDLSTYGLQRTRLNHGIELDDSESELDPQNPNPRGSHGGDEETDPLDEIIRAFNERWFQGWSATPEEQRAKFVDIANNISTHPDFEKKYQSNKDPYNRDLAFAKIFEDVMLKNRRTEMELYKLLATDSDFKTAMQQSLRQMVSS